MTNQFLTRTALCVVLASIYPVAATFAAETVIAFGADHSVKSWKTTAVDANTTQIVVTLDKPLGSNVSGFIGAERDFIALDFPKTTLGESNLQKTKTEPFGLVTSSRWAESATRTRLVLSVNKNTSYSTTNVGDDVVITLKNNSTPKAFALAESSPAVYQRPVSINNAIAVRDIEYKKTTGNNGQLTIDLSDPGVKVRVYRDGSNLSIDMPATALPRNLTKRFKVSDLDTPVQAIIPTVNRDGTTHISLDMVGSWDYSFAQNGSALAINVMRIGEDFRVGGKKVFTGKKMTLSFQSIEVRAVLQVLADFTGLNIIASDTVTGSLTLQLADVPWDQALDLILRSRNLDMRRTGNVITIAPKAEILAQEEQDLKERKAHEAAEPQLTETFQLNYQKASKVKTLIETQAASSTGGNTNSAGTTSVQATPPKVRLDDSSNQLIITGTASQLSDIRDIIKTVDIPTRQVSIEAKIVEINDSFEKNIGFNFGYNDSVGNSYNSGRSNVKPKFGVNLPANPSSTGASPGSFGFSLFNSGLTRFLNLELQALEADGVAKTITKPRVLVANNVEAVIQQGEEIPYQSATSSGATSVSFKTIAMVLKVTPQITANGKVGLNIKVNKDSVGRVTTAGFGVETKAVDTQVLVDDGGTIVIGGIFVESEANNVNKIPLLGDLPVVGAAFRNTAKSTSRKELVIMITPTVIDSLTEKLQSK